MIFWTWKICVIFLQIYLSFLLKLLGKILNLFLHLSGQDIIFHEKNFFLCFWDRALFIPPHPEGEGGILFYLCPSVQDIFRRIFLSNCWWQKSDIWSRASYRYTILWVAFLDPSDSYFLFADFGDFYTHLTYICICTFFVAFVYATIDDRNLIFGHKLHIGMPYCGKRFWTHQIPTSCLPT